MQELAKFDSAQKKHLSDFDFKEMPLISWDFYGNYFLDSKNLIADASKLNELSQANSWKSNWNFLEKLKNDTVIVVTDMNLKIVFTSQNSIAMTGYLPEEVIGNSPKMFQGKETAAEDLKHIRASIHSEMAFEKTVVNYKKNGEKYNCHIQGFPVFNTKEKVIHFIAFEKVA